MNNEQVQELMESLKKLKTIIVDDNVFADIVKSLRLVIEAFNK